VPTIRDGRALDFRLRYPPNSVNADRLGMTIFLHDLLWCTGSEDGVLGIPISANDGGRRHADLSKSGTGDDRSNAVPIHSWIGRKDDGTCELFDGIPEGGCRLEINGVETVSETLQV
jgi:hypothetical protein